MKSTVDAGGYSGTQLAKKLGLKEGFKIRLINQPADYFNLFTDLLANLQILQGFTPQKNFIHCFITEEDKLRQMLPVLKNEILPNGMIWVSWPKKAAKLQTDISENVIRAAALSIGLVDIKVCAIDETWSGLKLVIPVKDRVNKLPSSL